jgi:hypothetical protein
VTDMAASGQQRGCFQVVAVRTARGKCVQSNDGATKGVLVDPVAELGGQAKERRVALVSLRSAKTALGKKGLSFMIRVLTSAPTY